MARRINGEGTIYQHPRGFWVGQTYVLLPNGGQKRRTVYGPTREDVLDKLTRLRALTLQGVPAPDGRVRLDEYLPQWLEQVAARKVRPRTVELYRMVIDRHILPALGRKRLDRLTPVDIRRLLNAKADTGLSASSCKKIHIVLGSALQQAVRDELLSRNVARLVQWSAPPARRVQPLSLDAARRFLQAARGDRLYALWAVAIGLGLRRGEALGLRWQDVDVDGLSPTLRVEVALQRIGGQLRLDALKTERSRRTLPLPAASVQALKARREEQAAEREALESWRRERIEQGLPPGPAWEDTGLVFTTRRGTAIEPRNLVRSFDSLSRRAGVGGYWEEDDGTDDEGRPRRRWVRTLRFHDLRHTCATLLLAQGVPLRVVMELLGHSGINVTANIYGHVVPQLLDDATDRLNDALVQGDGEDDEGEDDGFVAAPGAVPDPDLGGGAAAAV